MVQNQRSVLNMTLAPIVDLVLRFYIAYFVLIEATYLKVWENVRLIISGHGHLTSVRYEVLNAFPFLPEPFASYLFTGMLFVGAILLAIGLLGRIGALLILVVHIFLWVYGYTSPMMTLLMLVLLTFLAQGSGVLSIDTFFRNLKNMR